jgi:hypothetical protein
MHSHQGRWERGNNAYAIIPTIYLNEVKYEPKKTTTRNTNI